jgi:hypothetical protein
MDCSAAKLGCRLYPQRPEVMKPRSRSACLKSRVTLPDFLYCCFADW